MTILYVQLAADDLHKAIKKMYEEKRYKQVSANKKLLQFYHFLGLKDMQVNYVDFSLFSKPSYEKPL